MTALEALWTSSGVTAYLQHDGVERLQGGARCLDEGAEKSQGEAKGQDEVSGSDGWVHLAGGWL